MAALANLLKLRKRNYVYLNLDPKLCTCVLISSIVRLIIVKFLLCMRRYRFPKCVMPPYAITFSDSAPVV
jgi:hypothetical protein